MERGDRIKAELASGTHFGVFLGWLNHAPEDMAIVALDTDPPSLCRQVHASRVKPDSPNEED